MCRHRMKAMRCMHRGYRHISKNRGACIVKKQEHAGVALTALGRSGLCGWKRGTCRSSGGKGISLIVIERGKCRFNGGVKRSIRAGIG